MSQLLAQIGDICERYSLPKMAFVIDDEWEERETPDSAAWQEFIQAISVDGASIAAFSNCLASLGHDLGLALSADAVDKVFAKLGSAVSPLMMRARENYVQSGHVLLRLESMLKGLNFTVEPYSSPPDFSKCAIPSLMLVDYHLSPEQQGGEHAEKIFAELMQRCRTANGSPPPFVILMSQKLLRDDRDKTLKLAERAGFFRFNYEFLHKEDIRRTPETFYLVVLNFFRHVGLSQAYFKQLLKLEEQTKRIATETANRFFQITPAEVLNFRPQTHKEGLDMATVLTDLFSEHVFAAVSRSSDVKACMSEVDRCLPDDYPFGWDVSEGGPLHRLYSDLLFTSTKDEESEAPKFGDIYEAPDKSLRLVVSQECDLACGGSRQAKARNILTIAGQIRETPPGKNDGGIISRPFFNATTAKVTWVWWNLMEPDTIPYQDLFGPPEKLSVEARAQFRKVFRLRSIDAENIQQQFAAKLTRVGNDILPGPIRLLTVTVQMQPANTSFQVEACAVSDGKDWSVALLKPAQLLDVPAEMRSKLTVDDLIKLGVFTRIKDFRNILKQAGIAPLNNDSELLLGFGGTKFWQGKTEWDGPK